MSARWGFTRRLLAGALCLWVLSGCREFALSLPDAGGEPGPCADVEGSFAECDNASSTYCETDLVISPFHCGGCGEKCDYLCFDGQCLSSEPVLTGVIFSELEDAMIVSARHIYALGEGADGDGLYRVSRDTLEVETLLQDLPSTSGFGLGVDRIYVHISDALHSLPLAGGSKLEVEVASDVELFAMHDGAPYWTNDGFLYSKASLGGQVNTLGTVPEGVDMLVGSDSLLLAVDAGDSAFRLFAWDASLGAFTEVSAGAGSVERTRLYGSTAYLLVEDHDGARAVLEYATDQSALPVRFDSTRKVLDFEVNGSFVYLAWEGDSYGGLDVIPMENPAYVITLGIDVYPVDMVVDGDDFYYLKYFPRHIFQLDLGLLH
jgi:hypothetical protein